MLKKKRMELLMAVLFLAAAYCLSREGAKLVENMEGQKKLVVVDPGHGGEDPGKIGINDEKEKDINLEISLMLREKLEKQGISVVMTRKRTKVCMKKMLPTKRYRICREGWK